MLCCVGGKKKENLRKMLSWINKSNFSYHHKIGNNFRKSTVKNLLRKYENFAIFLIKRLHSRYVPASRHNVSIIRLINIDKNDLKPDYVFVLNQIFINPEHRPYSLFFRQGTACIGL